MTIDRDRLRWNGWGRLGESPGFSPAREQLVLELLGQRLGRKLEPAAQPVALESLQSPPSKLTSETLETLRRVCGEAWVRTSLFERVFHALGRSLPDLLRLRRGEALCLPDAVVYPPDEAAVVSLLRVAREAGLAVIPFGGGSSVVGGVEVRTAPGQAGAVSLDTTRMDALLRIDRASQTATFQAGVDGPALEASLAEHGFTLGHFPQSFEHSTLGGWIAARSSGQESSGYGGIERMLVALRLVTPEGVLRTLEVPRSAAGPDLAQLVLGSEGTLGVIVEATLRIRPRPAATEARGLLFRSFSDGVETVRECVHAGLPLSMLRLSDAHETELFQLLRRDPERRFDPAALVLGAAERLGYGAGRAVMIAVANGTDRAAARRALRGVRSRARAHAGLPLGSSPGKSWRRDRFRTPYLRDWLLDYGVAVDTMETALPWSRLEAGHRDILVAMQSALEAQAGAGLSMAHLSHSYRDGASLYFTILYPLDASAELSQWRAIKKAATDAIVAAGGTLSHHHGIGSDHAPWLGSEKGELGMRALQAIRHEVDPDGIMNPGKLS